jgi:hypothetical protein
VISAAPLENFKAFSSLNALRLVCDTAARRKTFSISRLARLL